MFKRMLTLGLILFFSSAMAQMPSMSQFTASQQVLGEDRPIYVDAATILAANRKVEADIKALRTRLSKAREGRYTRDELSDMDDALETFDQVHKSFNAILGSPTKKSLTALVNFRDDYAAAKRVYIRLKPIVQQKSTQKAMLYIIDARFIALDKSMSNLLKAADSTKEVKRLLETLQLVLRLIG